MNNVDGNTEQAQATCLELCKKRVDATGCEVIWHQGNRGCYVHTKTVARGNGVGRHMCWVFSKCEAVTARPTLPPGIIFIVPKVSRIGLRVNKSKIFFDNKPVMIAIYWSVVK